MNFKIMVHSVLVASLIANPTFSFGAIKASHSPSSSRAALLKSALTDPRPKISGVEEFFRNDHKHGPELENSVVQDPDLAKLVQLGQKTRTSFMDYLGKQFGDSASYLIDPIQASIDLVQRLSPDQIRRSAKPLPEAEIARLAWHETDQLFGLQAKGLRFDDIEQQRRTDPEAANIYDFYKRSYFKRLEQEHQRPELIDLHPETLRRRLIDKLKDVRVKNFNALLSEIKPSDQLQIILTSGPKLKLRLDRIEFQDWQSPPNKNVPLSSYSHIWGKLGRQHLARAKLGDDIEGTAQRLNGITSARLFKIGSSSEVVTLQAWNPDLDVLTLPISELWHLLSDLELVISEGMSEPAVAIALRDTVARDIRLQELQSMIAHAAWEESTQLVEQLEAFNAGYRSMRKTDRDELTDRPSMMAQTTEYRELHRTLNTVDHLRWSGYRYGAGYWTIRDEVALEKNFNLENLSKLLLLSENQLTVSKAGRTHNKFIRVAQDGRKGKIKEILDMGKGVLGAGLVFMLFGFSGGVQHLHQMFAGANSSDISAAQDLQDPTNHSSSENEKEKDNILFQVLNSSACNTSCPKYISMPTLSNIADVVKSRPEFGRRMGLALSNDWNRRLQELDNGDLESKFSLFRNIDRPVEWLKHDANLAQEELVLKTWGKIKAAPLYPSEGADLFLPLPAPSKYVINKILLLGVNDDGTTYMVNPDSYTVFVDTWTGMQFAQFQGNNIGGPGSRGTQTNDINKKYTAILSYKFNAKINEAAADSEVQPKTVRRISDRLLRSGLPNMAGELLKYSPASLSQFASVTEKASIYTYRSALPETTPFKTISDTNNYSYYKRFLIEGPSEPLFLQCTGAAALTGDLIQDAITYDSLIDTRIERMHGFRFDLKTVPGLDPTINGPGHQWNVLTKTDQPFQYMEIDGTPTTMDEKKEAKEGLIETIKGLFAAMTGADKKQNPEQEKPNSKSNEGIQGRTTHEQTETKQPQPKERIPLVRPELAIRPRDQTGVQPGTGWESHKKLDPASKPPLVTDPKPDETKKLSSLERLIQARDQYWRSLSALQDHDSHVQFTEDPLVTRTLRFAAEAERALTGQDDATTLDLRMIRIFDQISPKETGAIVDRHLERRLREWSVSPLAGSHPISKFLLQNEIELTKHLADNSKSEEPALWLSETSVSKALLGLASVLRQISGELADQAEGLAPGERCGNLLQ